MYSLGQNSKKKFKKARNYFTSKDNEVDNKYKKHIIKKLEKNVVDDIDMNFIFATGLDLKEGLIDPRKANAILAKGTE